MLQHAKSYAMIYEHWVVPIILQAGHAKGNFTLSCE